MFEDRKHLTMADTAEARRWRGTMEPAYLGFLCLLFSLRAASDRLFRRLARRGETITGDTACRKWWTSKSR